MFIGTLGFFICCDLFCDTTHILEVSVPRNVLSAKTVFLLPAIKVACGGRELGGRVLIYHGVSVKVGSTAVGWPLPAHLTLLLYLVFLSYT